MMGKYIKDCITLSSPKSRELEPRTRTLTIFLQEEDMAIVGYVVKLSL